MDEKRRTEIYAIVSHFQKTPNPEQKVIDAYCTRMKYETIIAGELQDYAVQVAYDNLIATLIPEIVKILSSIKHAPEFAPEHVRKNVAENNERVRIEIIALFEKHAIEYVHLELVREELKNVFSSVIGIAAQTCSNKSLEAILDIAKKKFGGHITTQDVAGYFDSVLKKKK